ncbi:hypothetical protein CKAH01_02236 [Colletotrichum kahawae]|uniref:Uncharacterized protein n=1 Tax=Colletotrichum kahawae TaxID=34407 RepID=A0AAD9Y0H8_COLKA|nr:hypothetical protein CKAH01_02236 [Colletotrichum kahawae]
MRRPPFAETFAEYSEAGLVDERVDDTGPTIRAFLPFESTETRESVSTFRGMTRVSDSRVVCLRPILSNLTLCEIEISDSESNIGICGVLQLNRTDDIKLLWDMTGHNIPTFSDYDLYNPSSLDMLGSTANGPWTSQFEHDSMRAGENTKYGTGRMMNDFLGSLFDRSQDAPILLCSDCLLTWSPSYVMVDDLYTQLFEDTLNATSSPARALQAMYFTLERSVYYDQLSRYLSTELNDSEPAVAEIMTFEVTQVPEHHRGYWAVVGIITALLATLAVVAWLYRPMLYSLPGNSWHAIAQVSESAELADLLRKARLSTDKEVEQMIGGTPKNTSGRGDGFVIYAKEGLRRAQQRFLAVFKSSASSGSQKKVSHLVLQEGVFVRVSEEEAYTELKASGFRRRLARRDSWSESSDGRVAQ